MTREPPLLAMLRVARAQDSLLADLPAGAAPDTLAQAYAIARELMTGQRIAGWKVGATSIHGQQFLRIQEPLFGRIVADTVIETPGEFRGGADATYAIEPEIAFRLRVDLPARARPYELADIAAAVDAIAPAIEINRPHYVRPLEAGALAIIADNGVNMGACTGAFRSDWQDIDLTSIAVSVQCNEAPPVNGHSSAVLGNPLQSLLWLANTLPRYDARLEAGQVVLSGAITPSLDIRVGNHVRAQFHGLGGVDLTVIPR